MSNPIHLPDPSHVLVFAPNWLGDGAMATPALRALSRRFPNAELTVAARGGVCALLDGLPWISSFVPLRHPLPLKQAAGAVQALRHAFPQAGPPDLAVVFPHSFRAALYARLSGARRRLGHARGARRWLLTDAVPPHRVNGKITPVYMAFEYLELVSPLGCRDDGEGLELHAPPEAVAKAESACAGTGPLVGIAPGAAFGPSKRWPPERFAAVADRLHEQCGARVVLLTGPGEEDTRKAVLSAARTPLLEPDRGKPTIDGLKAVISLLDALVCNDSGPRHVAIAFGVPTVCIMGPTAPVYSCGPYERGRVLRREVYCGPCQRPVCATDHRCMTRVSAGEVFDAAASVLGTPA